jgi:hypothetical protein
MVSSGQTQANENKEVVAALNTNCTEAQENTTVKALENADQDDSKQSKVGRGGKRQGAGRKPNLAKRLLKGFTRETIAQAAADVDVREVIVGLLKARSERTRLETLAFLRDTLYGRPAQSVSVSGALIHGHTDWRPLEQLSDTEVELLDSITKKLTTPANASQDGPQNQTESKPAIEAELVASGASR